MSESATNTSLDIKIDVTSRRECGRKGLARFLFLSQEHLYLRILLEYHLVADELKGQLIAECLLGVIDNQRKS